MEKLQDIGPALADAPKIFIEGGSKIVTEFYDKAVEGMTFDATTEEGRGEIKSRAYQLARVITKYDDMGKLIAEDVKKTVKVIDSERKIIRDHIESLQTRVRKPLDEFEEREANRVKLIREQLEALKAYGILTGEEDSAALTAKINAVNGFNFTDWQEFTDEATGAKLAITEGLNRKLAAAQKQEEERAELERLRAAEAERQRVAAVEAEEKRQREERERIAEEAASAERRKAEEKAEQERLAAKAETDRIEAERVAAVEAKRLAEEQAAESERLRIAQAQQAERDRVEAAAQAERDSLAAVEAERKRVADEQAEEKRKNDAREADVEHRKKINVAARGAIMEVTGLSEKDATEVIKSIASGLVPSVKIFY